MPLRPGDWLVSGVSVSVWLLGSTTPWRFAEYREVLNQMNTVVLSRECAGDHMSQKALVIQHVVDEDLFASIPWIPLPFRGATARLRLEPHKVYTMMDIIGYPVLVFVLSCVGLAFSAWLGVLLSRGQRTVEVEVHEDYGVVQAATLTLLGLIAGFTFSMALTRYDQRKNYEEAEANAIGTEYVRAGLLPAAEATKVQALLVSYVDQR